MAKTSTFSQGTFKWFSLSNFADVPTASTAPDNCRVSVLDVGAEGISDWVTDGVRWYPIGGTLTLAFLGAPATLIANVETIVLQARIPAGAWQVNDIVKFSNLVLTKSGATDTLNMTVRIGTAGTVADTALTGITAAAILAAANLAGMVEFGVKLLTATSAQKQGAAGQVFGSVSNAAQAAATVITSAAANDLFVSLSIASSGATDTVGIQSGRIDLVTP